MNRFFSEVKKNFGFGCMRLPMKGDEVDCEEFARMLLISEFCLLPHESALSQILCKRRNAVKTEINILPAAAVNPLSPY